MQRSVSFIKSCDTNVPVRAHIVMVEGLNGLRQHSWTNPDGHIHLFVECQICAGDATIGLKARTPFVSCLGSGAKPASSARFGHWVVFDVTYATLPPHANLSVRLWELVPGKKTCISSTNIPLFEQDGLLRQGSYACPMRNTPRPEAGVTSAEGAEAKAPTGWSGKDPWSCPRCTFKNNRLLPTCEVCGGARPRKRPQSKARDASVPSPSSHMNRRNPFPLVSLEARLRRYKHGVSGLTASQNHWLSKLSAATAKRLTKAIGSDDNAVQAPGSASNPLNDPALSAAAAGFTIMHIELPTFTHAVVYQEKGGSGDTNGIRKGIRKGISISTGSTSLSSSRIHPLRQWPQDPAVTAMGDHRRVMNNAMKLARRIRGSGSDALPNEEERARLGRVIKSTSGALLSGKDRNLVWTFRRYLCQNKTALNKFVRCVDWLDPVEAREAERMLKLWTPPDAVQALDLLSSEFRAVPAVRAYAVSRVHMSSDRELLDFLLPLAQALRYETACPSPLSNLLCKRAASNWELANFLFWFLKIETVSTFRAAHSQLIRELERTQSGRKWMAALRAQDDLLRDLKALGDRAREGGRRTDDWIAHMRGLLSEGKSFSHLADFKTPIRFPLRPTERLTGVVGSKTTMFRSALAPLLVTFRTLGGGDGGSKGGSEEKKHTRRVIFKSGDDLRQDQLIISLINLMDGIFKRYNLDLRLTPYRVLATSRTEGLVEFVESSSTLSTIIADYPDTGLLGFLRKHNPGDEQLATARENFVRSCAGYCVITYVLGIGDRHLDNLLMTESGHLFHIDFGFIFGQDPKPWPSPIRIVAQMIEAMGGREGKDYSIFQKHCCWAFNRLRRPRESRLILNQLTLMKDMLEDGVSSQILHVQNKLALHLDDSKAEEHILSVIEASVSALAPQVFEGMHKIAQAWR